jgi:hypothetical protein
MKLPNGWASTQFSFRFLNETINRWSLTPLILFINRKTSKLFGLLTVTIFTLLSFGCGNSNSEVKDKALVTYQADPSAKDSAGVGCGQFGYFNDKLQEIDGQKDVARVGYAQAMTIDSHGNIYFTDGVYHTIREIKVNGEVVNIAGQSGEYGCNDGNKNEAHLFNPESIVVDKDGIVFFYDHHMVRKVALDGSVTTIAGVSSNSGIKDGRGREASFWSFNAKMIIGRDGNLYVGDQGALRKITPEGVVTTLAGVVNAQQTISLAGGKGTISFPENNSHVEPSSVDGPLLRARFKSIGSIAYDKNNNIYVDDSGILRKVSPDGEVTTVDENLKPRLPDIKKSSFVSVPSLSMPPFIEVSVDPTNTTTLITDIVIDRRNNFYELFKSGIRKIDSSGRVDLLTSTNIGVNNNRNLDLGMGSLLTIDDTGNVYGFRPYQYKKNGIVKINPLGDLSLVLERASDEALKITALKKQN